MYHEYPKSASTTAPEEPPVEMVASEGLSNGLLVALVLLVAVLLSGIIGVKAWSINEEIRHRKRSKRNPQRRLKLSLYIFALVVVAFSSQVVVFSIAFH